VSTKTEMQSPAAKRSLEGVVQPGSAIQLGKPMVPVMSGANEPWVTGHSAGLVISQAFDAVSNEPIGTVTSGSMVIGLGETPPIYRYQLQASGFPFMLGDKHQRQTFEIHATSLIVASGGTILKYPLSVSYPRWPRQNAGLETSGGFVFMRDEVPLSKIGVIVPKVIPERGESVNDSRWQIQIRVDDKLSNADVQTKAKPQSLVSDVKVLMATHPENIPTSSLVVWFKFEKDGTLSLLDD
jgi:hypothetical protein